MQRKPWFGLAFRFLRLLAIIVIVAMLIPRLFLAFVDLYHVLLHEDKVPSGHPMKVDAPLRDKGTMEQ